MRVQYSTTASSQDEFDALPRLPLRLRAEGRDSDVLALVDSGATVNVMPFAIGTQLGFVWDEEKANLRLAGNLGSQPAMPVFVWAEIGDFPPIRLAFAWTRNANIPHILGQTNFFMEFEVCFYRRRLEFEVKPALAQ